MKKKKLIAKLLSPALVPLAKNYVRQERNSKFLGLNLKIPVGIFHPSLFFSTTTMGKYLLSIDLHQKKIFEIGCGSGALSILAAKQGAQTFCSDINPKAVEITKKNATENGVHLTAVQSDLLKNVAEKNFDIILNNPPYYPKNPTTLEEHAWYAGKDFSYFKNLFAQTKNHLTSTGILLLVLTDDCDIEKINQLAYQQSWAHELLYTRPTIFEKTYVIGYRIGN